MMKNPFRIHMMYGKGLHWGGHSPMCWKYPRTLDTEKAGLSLNWSEVNCQRCLALKPDSVPIYRTISDGFGTTWHKCDRKDCGLQIVRPGKAQCAHGEPCASADAWMKKNFPDMPAPQSGRS